MKTADINTLLLPHQQRVLDKLKASHGLLVAHGVGSGKCVRGDTVVVTNRGAVQLRDLFGDRAEGPEDALTWAPETPVLVVSNVDGVYVHRPVRHFYRQRLPDTETTLVITTLRGNHVELTGEHPLPVIRDGVRTWVPAGDVEEGDWLEMPGRIPTFGTGNSSDARLAELLAWQVSEGWEGPEGATSITQDDLKVLRRLRKLFKTLYPHSNSGHIRTSTSHCPTLNIECIAYRRELERRGYRWGKRSRHKQLPAWVFAQGPTILRVVLRACFDAEGHAGARNIEFTSASKTLVRQVQLGLLAFGVRSALHSKLGHATNGTGIDRRYYRLSISGEDAETFTREVGFGDHRKAERSYKTKHNCNIGVPILWLRELARSWGLGPKIFNFNPKCHSLNVAHAKSTVERLRWLALEGAAHYTKRVKALGNGPAGVYAQRTLAVIKTRKGALLEAARKLERLLNSDARYEPVASVRVGQQGGYVYDLEVDSDVYDEKNYVANGLLLHNTLTSIAAADALGLPIEAIVPAPLVENYHKELNKHLDEPPADARVRSYEKAVRDKDINLNALAVMDEAHRARNSGTLIARDVAGQVAHAKARLLLTGTPVYNQPYDLANLLNTAAGHKVLPDDPALFKKTFVGEERVEAPLWERTKGYVLGHPVDAVTRAKLINRQYLVNAAKGYVDVHKGGGEGFPTREDVVHEVEMSPRQHEMYNFHANQMPWYLKAKIRAGLPLDKQESKELNAFQGALRQASNTPRPYDESMTDDEEIQHTPKIQMMARHLKEMSHSTPNFRGLVYSNYLGAGLEPMSRALTKAGINHAVFTGEVPKAKRDQMVKDYNSGKNPILLVSGAGSEGLDLKGTKAIQIMEPHWNESRLNQVIGRGIRYQSHAHLPEAERRVKVMRYQSTLPYGTVSKGLDRLTGQKAPQSVEQYMKGMSAEKDRFGNQIAEALQEASDAGPLQKRSALATLHRLKLEAAGTLSAKLAATTRGTLSAKLAAPYVPGDNRELMQLIADRMGSAELVDSKRKHTLDFSHPTGIVLKNKYDADFVREKIEDQFHGDPKAYANQLRDDMLGAGYAAIGDVTKKDQQKRNMRGLKGRAWGSLIGLGVGHVAGGAASMMLPENRFLAITGPALGRMVGVFGGMAVGKYVGEHTHKTLGVTDMEASQTHPLLIPPKVIKQRTTLKVKE